MSCISDGDRHTFEIWMNNESYTTRTECIFVFKNLDKRQVSGFYKDDGDVLNGWDCGLVEGVVDCA